MQIAQACALIAVTDAIVRWENFEILLILLQGITASGGKFQWKWRRKW